MPHAKRELVLTDPGLSLRKRLIALPVYASDRKTVRFRDMNCCFSGTAAFVPWMNLVIVRCRHRSCSTDLIASILAQLS